MQEVRGGDVAFAELGTRVAAGASLLPLGLGRKPVASWSSGGVTSGGGLSRSGSTRVSRGALPSCGAGGGALRGRIL